MCSSSNPTANRNPCTNTSGTAKSDPARYAPRWQPPDPWTVTIDGECAKPGRLALDDILKPQTLEDRIYRLRCVEGW